MYTPSYDKNTPIVVLHGIGQNNTYIFDGNGNRKLDKNGDYITGWPLEIDVMALVSRILPNFIFSIFTRKDNGLSQAMKEGAYELLYAVHKDNEGNYENSVEVPCYPYGRHFYNIYAQHGASHTSFKCVKAGSSRTL